VDDLERINQMLNDAEDGARAGAADIADDDVGQQQGLGAGTIKGPSNIALCLGQQQGLLAECTMEYISLCHHTS
jgi:hypothetical protein